MRIQPTKVRASEVEPVEMLPGIQRRTLADGERLMITQVLISQGTELPAHSHPHEQISYIVSGELEMRVGDQSYHLRPGDSLLLPSGMEHSALALQDVVVIDTFSPPREEYK
ncbi:MAG: cupin domain-containing protein [Chloroflexota bacterium]|nr:cupin domain-containing protein [Chloroflexota bacterium]